LYGEKKGTNERYFIMDKEFGDEGYVIDKDNNIFRYKRTVVEYQETRELLRGKKIVLYTSRDRIKYLKEVDLDYELADDESCVTYPEEEVVTHRFVKFTYVQEAYVKVPLTTKISNVRMNRYQDGACVVDDNGEFVAEIPDEDVVTEMGDMKFPDPLEGDEEPDAEQWFN
jgi:hypothetical protein